MDMIPPSKFFLVLISLCQVVCDFVRMCKHDHDMLCNAMRSKRL